MDTRMVGRVEMETSYRSVLSSNLRHLLISTLHLCIIFQKFKTLIS